MNVDFEFEMEGKGKKVPEKKYDRSLLCLCLRHVFHFCLLLVYSILDKKTQPTTRLLDYPTETKVTKPVKHY